jgi:hypothetical protein
MGTCKGKDLDGTDYGNPVKEGQDYCWQYPDQNFEAKVQGGEAC